jgi:hypothetical protein
MWVRVSVGLGLRVPPEEALGELEAEDDRVALGQTLLHRLHLGRHLAGRAKGGERERGGGGDFGVLAPDPHVEEPYL